MNEEDYKKQYLQEFIVADEAIESDNYEKYVHRKTGKIVEAEYSRWSNGQWLYSVKNPDIKEHRLMGLDWFKQEYEKHND